DHRRLEPRPDGQVGRRRGRIVRNHSIWIVARLSALDQVVSLVVVIIESGDHSRPRMSPRKPEAQGPEPAATEARGAYLHALKMLAPRSLQARGLGLRA